MLSLPDISAANSLIPKGYKVSLGKTEPRALIRGHGVGGASSNHASACPAYF